MIKDTQAFDLAVNQIANKLRLLKSSYPANRYVLVEGRGDKEFYSFVFGNDTRLRFVCVSELIEDLRALRRKEGLRWDIRNCEVIPAVVRIVEDCYGIVDQDYKGAEAASQGVDRVIVTDACDLETTRIWSCVESYYDLMASIPVQDDPRGQILSLGERSLENSILLFLCRNMLKETPRFHRLPLEVIYRFDQQPTEKIRVALDETHQVLDMTKLIELQKDSTTAAHGYDYSSFLCEIENSFYLSKQSDGVLANPLRGFTNQEMEKRLRYWCSCRGHDFFFFLQVLCPTIESYLNRETKKNDPLMRRRLSLETVFGQRTKKLPFDIKVAVIEAFLKTKMGQRMLSLNE